MAAELSLEPECRRGHGAVYKALNRGQVRVARLRWALAALPLPTWDDGRIRLTVDVSNRLRPKAEASPERPDARPAQPGLPAGPDGGEP